MTLFCFHIILSDLVDPIHLNAKNNRESQPITSENLKEIKRIRDCYYSCFFPSGCGREKKLEIS